jgi:hypothetical protein
MINIKITIIAVAAFTLATALWGGDLRVIYPYNKGFANSANFIIDRDEILYIEAGESPEIKTGDPLKPPTELGPRLADIHLKNGMILHVTMVSIEDLAKQLNLANYK